MGWQLGATDEKKTIQVGSFRLDERGRQKGAVQVKGKLEKKNLFAFLDYDSNGTPCICKNGALLTNKIWYIHSISNLHG